MSSFNRYNPVSFSANIDSEGKIIIPPEKLVQIDGSIQNFKITVAPELDKIIELKGMKRDELNVICVNQGIPEETAIEFYECKGSIEDKSFLIRIDSYAG
jgi:hypothetical protein